MPTDPNIIQICNEALSAFCSNRITDFSDSTEEAKLSALLFYSSYLELVQSYDWNFAKKRISYDSEDATLLVDDFLYSYSFELPADFSRPYDKTNSTFLYSIKDNVLYTDKDSINFEYIAISDDYSSIPSYFRKALVDSLSARLASGLDQTIAVIDRLNQKSFISLESAKMADIRFVPTALEFDITKFAWIAARH